MSERLWLADRWRPVLTRHGFDHLDAFLTTTRGRRVSWREEGLETLAVELPGETIARTIFVKRYGRYRGDWHYYYRAGRLRHEAEALRWLATHGFPAPGLIAWGDRRCGGVTTASFLTTAGLEETVTLAQYLSDGTPLGQAPIEALWRLVGRLHRAGFFHGNLYRRNILLRPTTGELFVIDFPASRIGPPWPLCAYAAIRDVSGLAHDLCSERSPDEWFADYARGRWPDAAPGEINRRAIAVRRRVERHQARRQRRRARRVR